MRGVSLDRLQRRAAPYVFVSPFFVLFAVFGVYPIIHSLYLSFFNQVGVGAPMTFIGADNYLALARDARFVRALFNTSYYAAGSIFVILPTALLAAVILNAAEVRWKHFFRLTYFMPYLTSAVVVAIIFILLYDDRYGLLNYLLNLVGLPSIRWLTSEEAVMPAIIILGLWKWSGVNILYFVAGLQGIPKELEEAARIDGANRPQVFWYVTLPLLRHVALFVVILATIGSYNIFAEPYLLTSGGPGDASLTITMYLYQNGFEYLKFGYASAIAYSLVSIVLFLSLMQMRLFGMFRED